MLPMLDSLKSLVKANSIVLSAESFGGELDPLCCTCTECATCSTGACSICATGAR